MMLINKKDSTATKFFSTVNCEQVYFVLFRNHTYVAVDENDDEYVVLDGDMLPRMLHSLAIDYSIREYHYLENYGIRKQHD